MESCVHDPWSPQATSGTFSWSVESSATSGSFTCIQRRKGTSFKLMRRNWHRNVQAWTNCSGMDPTLGDIHGYEFAVSFTTEHEQ